MNMGLCLLSVWFQRLTQLVAITLFITWFVDSWLSQRALQRGDYGRRIHLRLTNEAQIRWQWTRPHRSPLIAEFPVSEVYALEVQPHLITGGAFASRIGWVWQGQLRLRDGSNWIIEEDANLDIVLAAVTQVGQWLPDVPRHYSTGTGWGNGVVLQPGNQFGVKPYHHHPGIQRQTTKSFTLIQSRWRWQETQNWLQQVIEEGGFAIFVVIVLAVMTEIGRVIDALFFQGGTINHYPCSAENLSVATGNSGSIGDHGLGMARLADQSRQAVPNR